MRLSALLREILDNRRLNPRDVAVRVKGLRADPIYAILSGRTKRMYSITLRLIEQALEGKFIKLEAANDDSWIFRPDHTQIPMDVEVNQSVEIQAAQKQWIYYLLLDALQAYQPFASRRPFKPQYIDRSTVPTSKDALLFRPVLLPEHEALTTEQYLQALINASHQLHPALQNFIATQQEMIKNLNMTTEELWFLANLVFDEFDRPTPETFRRIIVALRETNALRKSESVNKEVGKAE